MSCIMDVLKIADRLRLEFLCQGKERMYAEIMMFIHHIKTDNVIRASIVSGHLEVLTVNTNEYKMVKELQEAITQMYEPEYLGFPVADMDLSVSSLNCLDNAGIKTLEELSNLTVEDVKRIRNLGQRCFEEITRKLKEFGYSFRESEEQN